MGPGMVDMVDVLMCWLYGGCVDVLVIGVLLLLLVIGVLWMC